MCSLGVAGWGFDIYCLEQILNQLLSAKKIAINIVFFHKSIIVLQGNLFFYFGTSVAF